MPKHLAFRSIPTRYKGYSFRSRLEARWAVFFDHLGIRWDYEPQGFELGNGLRYLPDFWLPDWQLWVEVKPGPPDDAGREKAIRLCALHDKPVLVVSGMPGTSCTFYFPASGMADEYAAWVPWCEERPVIYVQAPAPEMECEAVDIYGMGRLDSELYGAAELALMAARGAQFEFGKKGAA